MKMTQKDLNDALGKCMGETPPDFEKAKQLLAQGADINAEGDCDDETLLSSIMMAYYYGEDGVYLPEVVRFFLDSGYDVRKDNGRYGGEALYALCFSSYDKYILDAAKLLLDAGADPLYVTDTIPEDENVLDAVLWKYSGCLPVGGSLEQQCLFWVLYDVMKAKSEGKPYAEIAWWEAAKGKRIDRIFSCMPSPEEAVFDFATRANKYHDCFKDNIVLDCEGTMLVVTHYCHVFVNPYDIPPKTIDLTDSLGVLIGKRISNVEFRLNGNQSVLYISLDDGSAFVVRDNADQKGEEYCAWFAVEPQ